MKNYVIHEERATMLTNDAVQNGPILYWMHREQRLQDNYTLLEAQAQAIAQKQSLVIVFCIGGEGFLVSKRQLQFMKQGFVELYKESARWNIPFIVLEGNPVDTLPLFATKLGVGRVFTDFNPLKQVRREQEAVMHKLGLPFVIVDAHNIVPCKQASPKLEFGAYTIRPKIHKQLDNYLQEFPPLREHPIQKVECMEALKIEAVETKRFMENVEMEPDFSILSGEKQALQVMKNFIHHKLSRYDQRNNPCEDVCSGLSPYLHFGQISALRVALEVQKDFWQQTDKTQNMKEYTTMKDSFLEELIVRRELSDNYCFYNPNYDAFEGFPNWAQITLNAHRADKRTHMYSLEVFEQARTHDLLWNSAQMEMQKFGKMSGYMRMYWAKKILEWTESPEEAFAFALYLNDTYSLDGNDPNGYVGVAWSVGGVHDRAWGERPVFGKIRYMNDQGCKRKFDVQEYIKKMHRA